MINDADYLSHRVVLFRVTSASNLCPCESFRLESKLSFFFAGYAFATLNFIPYRPVDPDVICTQGFDLEEAE